MFFSSLSKSVNSFYLDTVASGCVEKVKALFDYAKTDRSLNFNKNFINNRDYDALRIAIENNDTAMCRLLLKHRVILLKVSNVLYFLCSQSTIV